MGNGFPESRWKSIAARSPDPLGVMRSAERIWEALDQRQRDLLLLPEESGRAVADLFFFMGACPGLVPFVLRHPEETIVDLFVMGGLHESGLMERGSPHVEGFLDACTRPENLELLSRKIARFRNIQLMRLYAQEILGLRPCKDIWREWSQVACWCIEGALLGVKSLLGDEIQGIRMVVLGMGKLGGEELNFSSDVDLIYLYEAEAGREPGSARQAADHWARSLTQVLEGPTDEGPLFRVDLGLRPGGKDGALTITVDAAELYYQSLGSPWERWALVRAHPVAGDTDLGQEFMSKIEPFVYRSSLDYTSLEDIRQMKARIQQEARWRAVDTIDLKMGQGGIRELEFLVQTLQIIHGGRRPDLRVRGTLSSLEVLAREGIVRTEDAHTLSDAYRFLRQVEHRVQMAQLTQTHHLPANERELTRIASLMGYGDGRGVGGMMDDLKEHMGSVQRAFMDLVAEPAAVAPVDKRVEEILGRMDDDSGSLEAIRRAGFREPAAVRASLQRVFSYRFPAARSSRARQILPRILPRMLSRVIQAPSPDQTLFRMERLLEVIGPRAGYYALLEERPRALERLMELLSRSAMLSRWLSEHVEALDALVAGHYDEPSRTSSQLRDEANRLLGGVEDTEERLGRLRLFRAQEYLRIGVGDLWGVLHPWEVGQELTRVAELYLELTLAEVIRASGLPPAPNLLPLSIVGLGSFGAQELSYRSDLDLMFLYDETTPWRPPDGIGGAEFLTRVAQRTLSWMSMPMKEGPGWAVDTRLRPSGTRGPLMVSLGAFREYYRRMGRAWERQMLLRARVCGGDPEVGQRVMGLVDAVLLGSGPPDPKDLHEMRMRMERERARQSSREGFHLKLGPGGMTDIEFLVQFHQWRGWGQDPRLRSPNTVQVMDRLVETKALSSQEGRALRESHAFLKGLENRLGLVLDHRAMDQSFSSQEIRALGSLEEMGWVPPTLEGEDLPRLLSRVMAGVREIYLKHLCPTP